MQEAVVRLGFVGRNPLPKLSLQVNNSPRILGNSGISPTNVDIVTAKFTLSTLNGPKIGLRGGIYSLRMQVNYDDGGVLWELQYLRRGVQTYRCRAATRIHVIELELNRQAPRQAVVPPET
jgi:hypothetical protein